MKLCVVYGDLTSDLSSENYPTDNVCDDCLKNEKRKIVHIAGEYDKNFGDSCHFCGKTFEQEKLEK